MLFKSKRKKREAIYLDSCKVKTGYFNFSSIKEYWVNRNKSEKELSISDRTFRDLDLDEIFIFLDRTTSKVGQQCLYASLRTIPLDHNRIERQEKLISQFKNDIELKKSCLLVLSKLNKPDAYNICHLFQQEYLRKPKWFWLLPTLSALSFCSLIGAFFFPSLLIGLIFILAINYCFHYWNKNNLLIYTGSIVQLLRLVQVSKKLNQLSDYDSSGIEEAIKKLDKLGNKLAMFKVESKLESEFGQVAAFFIEIIKALFLFEPLLLFRSLKALESQKEHIENVFNYVGELDVAIAIDNLRKGLNNHCEFTPSQNNAGIDAINLYHPLLKIPVSNSIETKTKSVLLTGSNMSGKTTFIRTIGINAILGQCINVCFADRFSMKRTHVHSAIHMADNLISERSYYFEEVLTIKGVLAESTKEHSSLLLLDELFKGTNTLERIAAGKAVLSHMHKTGSLVFIATHDLELADYLNEDYVLYHFSESVLNGEVEFDYRLKKGKLKNTNAIKILEANGYPEEVILDAFNTFSKLKDKKTNQN
jgi:DNA mismatch repair ATPase MutS